MFVPKLNTSGGTLCVFFLSSICIILATLLMLQVRSPLPDEDVHMRFPEGFTIGAGGSAYQTEGSWNASGRGESVWDRLTHTQQWKFLNGSNGDIACDSYHKYKEDVQWVKKLKLGYYRFSISWPRVLPNGLPESISHDGLQYYHNLIDELLANGIEPNVLLYHWDHPQVLEDMGGWTNESMVEWFADYANVIFWELGPKVKLFTTLNEPQVFCDVMYVSNMSFTSGRLNVSAGYICGHNALKAHARAYHIYDTKYRPTQHGQVGIVSVCPGYFPKNPNETLAAEMSFQITCGWMSHPIYIGDYPEIIKIKRAEANKDSNSSGIRLPEFSPEWIEYIKGTADFFGLNYYSSLIVERGVPDDIIRSPRFLWDIGVRESTDPSWMSEPGNLIYSVPEGFGDVLRKIKKDYDNPPVYIMENGYPDTELLFDYRRMKYLHSHLKELLLAVNRDGCNVQKYTVWSLMDNFEWVDGYDSVAMGLIRVNFSNSNRERVPKLSFFWLQNMMHTRRLEPPMDSTIER